MGTTIFALLAFVWAFLVNKGERRKVFYSYYRRLCIRFHIGSHYEAKDICKIQILKKEKTVLGL